MKKDYFIEEEILNKIPVSYRFFIKEKTKKLGELMEFRSSQSDLHRTNEYKSHTDFKPLSNIFLDY